MERIASILIPYNFSEPSEKALQYAFEFAGRHSSMHLKICFIGADEKHPDFELAFTDIKASLNKAFVAKLSWTSLPEPTVEALLQKQLELKSDLVIMGTSGSDDPTATTHTSQMVLEATCPVLVIPGEITEEFRLKKIALILGQREIDDKRDLATLLDVCRKFNAVVHVLTVAGHEGGYGYSEEEETNEELLEYYLESFYSNHVFIEKDDVVAAIFDYVEEHEMDIIAIFPNNHTLKGTPSEGRLTRILSLQSKTPLLAIEN
ncbi:universal stress protein [Robiginitalea sp. IMCC44478]|uniref:universal stress protein n=1 Tax=Robiginitalea sp. IMCC44478 TaxID=3459122 RepID=UPI004040ECA7